MLERRTPEQLLGTPNREYQSHSGSFTAAKRDRARSGPLPFSGAADAHLDENSHSRLRAFCNDIDRNADAAASLLDVWSDTLVGERGYLIQAWTDDEDWNTEAEESFEEFCEAPTLAGDAEMADVLKAAVRDWGTDGDLGFIWTNQNLAQPVEGERICNPSLGTGGWGSPGTIVLENGGRITRGVETDAAGRRVAYWIAEYDQFGRLDRKVMRRIPAASFYLCKNPFWRKSNQTRGIPHLARVVRPLTWITEFNEATTLAAIVGCNLMGVIKTKNPSATKAAMGDAAGESDEVGDDEIERETYGSSDLTTMAPLTFTHLGIDEDFDTVDPKHPTTSFEGFMTVQMRFAGNAFGLPYSVSMGDASKTNYYGMKVERGVLKIRASAGVRELKRLTRWFWRMWIGSQIDAKTLREELDWDKPKITPPPAMVIDEGQEIEGANKAVDGNYRTHDDVTQQYYGTRSADVKALRAQEKELDRKLGIVPMAAPGSKPMDGGSGTGGADPNQPGTGPTRPGNDPGTVEEEEEREKPEEENQD